MSDMEGVYVSPWASVGKGKALGISIKRDMLVLAVVGDKCLSNVEYFIHTSGVALRGCPYASDFRDKMNVYDKDFPVSRLLDDAIRGAEIVGFDPSEIKLSSKLGNFYPITNDNPHLTTALAHDLNTGDFLSVMEGHVEKDYQDRGEITRYFWNSLSSDVDGNKTWDSPADRLDPMLAVARAYAAVWTQLDVNRVAAEAASKEATDRAAAHSESCAPGRERVGQFLEDFRTNHRNRRVR
jgi:hypothetical protein